MAAVVVLAGVPVDNLTCPAIVRLMAADKNFNDVSIPSFAA